MNSNNISPESLQTNIKLYHFTNVEFPSFDLQVLRDKGTYQSIREVGFWFTPSEEWGKCFVKDKPCEKYWKWLVDVDSTKFFSFLYETDYRTIQTEYSHDNLFHLMNACSNNGYIGWCFKSPHIDLYLYPKLMPDQYVIWDKTVLSKTKCEFIE